MQNEVPVNNCLPLVQYLTVLSLSPGFFCRVLLVTRWSLFLSFSVRVLFLHHNTRTKTPAQLSMLLPRGLVKPCTHKLYVIAFSLGILFLPANHTLKCLRTCPQLGILHYGGQIFARFIPAPWSCLSPVGAGTVISSTWMEQPNHPDLLLM